MTRSEQAKFAYAITQEIYSNIFTAIEKGKIPGAWTGLQLRQLIADKAATYIRPMTEEQKKEYGNTLLAHNL